jgi:hypothetical protein
MREMASYDVGIIICQALHGGSGGACSAHVGAARLRCCRPTDERRGGRAVWHHPGMAVQVDPIKHTLKPPGMQCLKLNMIDCFQVCYNFAFKLKLRYYTPGAIRGLHAIHSDSASTLLWG